MTAKIPSLFEKAVLYWPGEHVAQAAAPKTITPAGDVKQILPFRGAGIGMFNGTTDYASVGQHSDFIFTGDATIEMWFYLLDNTDRIVLCFRNDTDTNYSFVFNPISATRFWIGFNGSAMDITSGVSLPVNTWHHAALVRFGSGTNNVKAYLNGVVIGSCTNTTTMGTSTRPITIGNHSTYYQKGYSSELRVSNVARYTGPFSPPRYKHIPDSNTKLLLHFTPTGTTFTDSSPSPKSITRYGDAKCITSPVEDGGVAYFDGSGDYLTIPEFEFGSSDFTIEGWYKFNSLSINQGLFSKRTNVANYPNIQLQLESVATPRLYVTNTAGNAWIIDSGFISAGFNITDWFHIAVVRYNSIFKLYVNGIVVYTSGSLSEAALYDNNSPWVIGAQSTIGQNCLNGSINEFRMSDIARYTAAFTPPTQPFQPDSYTKLLLHFWNTTPTVFLDSAGPVDYDEFPILPAGVTVTNAGTFLRELLPNGKSVMKFDGSTNYIALSDSDAWSIFENNFTICIWVKFNSLATVKGLFGQMSGTTAFTELYWSQTNNQIILYGLVTSATFDYRIPLTPVVGTWYHITFVRSGSTCLGYINAISQTVTIMTAWNGTTNIAAPLTIGAIDGTGYPFVYQNGNIKDLLIIKGKAMSPAEICEHMDRSHPITGEGLLPGGYDYWRLS